MKRISNLPESREAYKETIIGESFTNDNEEIYYPLYWHYDTENVIHVTTFEKALFIQGLFTYRKKYGIL